MGASPISGKGCRRVGSRYSCSAVTAALCAFRRTHTTHWSSLSPFYWPNVTPMTTGPLSPRSLVRLGIFVIIAEFGMRKAKVRQHLTVVRLGQLHTTTVNINEGNLNSSPVIPGLRVHAAYPQLPLARLDSTTTNTQSRLSPDSDSRRYQRSGIAAIFRLGLFSRHKTTK